MRISTRTRYGTRMMIRLGLAFGGKPVLLKVIAKGEDISEKYLSQIVLSLKAAGLVLSYRGASGGYALAKHPAEIKMRDIIKVLEGDLEVVECCGDTLWCNRLPLCATRDLWSIMGRSMEKTLSGITLNDIISRCKEKEQATVMYNI